MYVPNNVLVYIAAYSGSISGMAVAGKLLTDDNPADYAAVCTVAGAFAESFDTEWGLTAPTDLDLSIIEEECEGAFNWRYPNTSKPNTMLPATYTDEVKALIALVKASQTYFAGQGIVPPFPGGGGGPTLMEFTVFVAKNGNDGTADGSVGKPFLTVQAAMQYAWTTYVLPLGPQPVSPFTRPCVFVNAGTYDDGNLVLPPQICVEGEGYNHSRIVGNWTIDARWSNAGGADDFRSTWLNVGLFGDVTVDFGPVLSNEGKLYAQNVRFGGNVDITEKAVNPVSNSLIFTSCEFLGNVTLNGIPAILNGCTALFGAGLLTLNQLAGTPADVDNIFESNGGSFGNIVINSTIAPTNPPYQCKFNHSVQPDSTLTLNGAYSTIKADESSIPLQSNIVLMGGATLGQIKRINQPNFSGITANRPAAPYVGQQYFDTTLGSAIWWNGGIWVAGTPGPPGPGGGAVIFDGGVPDENARTARLTTQSPIDNTRLGIVNLSSRSAGVSVGVTASYGTCSGGDRNAVTALNGTCIGGILNVVSGIGSIAGGDSCVASGDHSVALGFSSESRAFDSVAIGHGAIARGARGISIGDTIDTSGLDSIGIGTRTVSVVDAICIGRDISANGARGITIGNNSANNFRDSVCIGRNNLADDINTVVIGSNSTSFLPKATAVGYQCTANNQYSVAMGSDSGSYTTKAVALGYNCQAGDFGAVLGIGAFAVGDTCQALADGSMANGISSVVLTTAKFGFAQGDNASVRLAGEWGRKTFPTSPLRMDGCHYVELAGEGNSVPVNLLLPDGTEIALDDFRAFSIRITILATNATTSLPEKQVWEITAKVVAGVLTIVDAQAVYTSAGSTFVATFSAPAGALFRVNCNPGVAQMLYWAKFEWGTVFLI
jgi:hypothetical protein